jgi:nitrite reductase/ring-hydroxylating ferredoxin subunit
MASFDYDVVIIGSGFGGSVAALRAAENGYRVGVMEAGLTSSPTIRTEPIRRNNKREAITQTMTKLATDAFRTLGPGYAIPNDFVVPYYLDDRKRRIAIARVDNRLYAFDDLCTCSDMPCPLSGGLLKGTTIMCQCHGSRFDITSGAVINDPAIQTLNVYDVQEDAGTVRIRA